MTFDLPDDELDLTGDLGLDFVNTLVWTRTGTVDLLDDPRSFGEWMARAAEPEVAALVPERLPDRRTLTVEARRLREALVALFRAVASRSRPPAPAAFAIDRALRAGTGAYGLRIDDGAPTVRTVFEGGEPLAVLTPIAASAVSVAGAADPDRLRECAAEDCARWFVDTSKGGRRRWCSMERCGNRAKAARYRRRRARGA